MEDFVLIGVSMFMTSLGWWGVGTGVFDIITYYSKSFSHRHMPYRVFGMVFGGTVDAGSHGAHRRTDHERTTHSHRSEIGSCDPTKIEVASKKASKPQRTVDAPLAIATLRF